MAEWLLAEPECTAALDAELAALTATQHAKTSRERRAPTRWQIIGSEYREPSTVLAEIWAIRAKALECWLAVHRSLRHEIDLDREA
jgi:hypothetical protein